MTGLPVTLSRLRRFRGSRASPIGVEVNIDWNLAFTIAAGLVVYRLVWACVAGVVDACFGGWLERRGMHPYR